MKWSRLYDACCFAHKTNLRKSPITNLHSFASDGRGRDFRTAQDWVAAVLVERQRPKGVGSRANSCTRKGMATTPTVSRSGVSEPCTVNYTRYPSLPGVAELFTARQIEINAQLSGPARGPPLQFRKPGHSAVWRRSAGWF